MKNKTKVEILEPIIEGQKKGDINYMKNKDALYYAKEGLVKILDNTPLEVPQTEQKEQKKEQKKENVEGLDWLYNNLKELIFKKYSIYFVLNDTTETYIVYDDKTSQTYLFSKQKLHQFLTIEYQKEYQILFDVKVKEMLNYLIEQNLIKNIFDIGFKPINQKEFLFEDKFYLNSFKPNKNLFKSNFKTYSGDFLEYLKSNSPNIYYLISNLCKFKKEQIIYFLNWLGHKVQKPYEKIERGIVFYGEESTGKGLFFDTILKEIFGEYSYLSNMKFYDPTHNQSNYNKHESKLLINAIDECYYLKSVEDIFKTKLTQKKKLINIKGGRQFEEQDFEDMLFFSNRELPIKAGDKRLSFIKSTKLFNNEVKANEWVLTEYIPNYKSEMSYLLDVLHYMPINELLLRNNLKNSELEEIKEQTKSLEEKFFDFMGDYQYLDELEEDLKVYSKHKRDIIQYNGNYISLNSIYDLYDLYLVSIDYEKKALNKSQLFKLLNIDIENKEEYKQLRFNKKACYCIHIDKLKKFLNKSEIEQEQDQEEYLESITINVN